MQRMRQGAARTGDGDMRRHLLIVAAFLLAGAVVNVAVAWGCAMRSSLRGREPSPPPLDVPDLVDGDDEAWLRQHDWESFLAMEEQWLLRRAYTWEQEGVGLYRKRFDTTWLGPPGSGIPIIPGLFGARPAFATRILSGWPLYSLSGELWQKPQWASSNDRSERLIAGIAPRAVPWFCLPQLSLLPSRRLNP